MTIFLDESTLRTRLSSRVPKMPRPGRILLPKSSPDAKSQMSYEICGLGHSRSAHVLGYLKSVRLKHRLLINFSSERFELRKFPWSQEAARRKSKPSFLFSALSAFSAFFAV